MKYKTQYGIPVTLLTTTAKMDLPVICLVHLDDGDAVMSVSSLDDLVAVPELEDLKVDDKVQVRNSGSHSWKNRHFAKIEHGRISCFAEGRTSFSVDFYDVNVWDYWRLPE